MPHLPTDPINSPHNDRYGAAAHFDFDNAAKWHTVSSVPLLDEHELTSEDGRPVAQVDRSVLEEIARNNNNKVRTTGDPATLILGHTSDDPRAPEKPAVGFITNLHVKPFKRGEDGRIIYALHGDYKIRPNKAHLIEEYPRRSVELWWAKRDVDPVALLGGSSPERDLGVVLRKSREAYRNSRLNHVSLDHTAKHSTRNGTPSAATEVIKFHKRGNFTIESYSIEDPRVVRRFSATGKGGKMEKVMHEFKTGALHSGSKSGPTVTSRKQAVAIGMNEAREHPHKKSTTEGNMGKMNGKPMRCEDDDDDKMRYGNADLDMDTHDAGDAGVPGEFDGDDTEGMDHHGSTDAGANGLEGEGDDDNDPMIQKVMQSKWAKGIDDKLSMILEALQGGPSAEMGGGEAGGGMGGMDGGAPGGAGGEEMPPPGMGGGGDAMGLPPGGGAAPPPTEEDSRRGMGQRPVQMGAGAPGASTGMPGSGDGYIPGMNGKSKGRMSRSTNSNKRGTTPMNGATRSVTQTPRGRDPRDVQILRLRRQNAEMQAREIIRDLEGEGVLFGRDPQSSEKIKYARIEELTLAILHDEDTKDQGAPDSYVSDKIDEMRLCYARRATDDRGRQRLPQSSGVARYARNPVQEAGAGAAAAQEADFEPTDDNQVVEMADLQAGTAPGQRGQKMDYPTVVKYMRKKYLGR